MEQRDYILREIEKISVVILAILGKLRRKESGVLFEQERELMNDEMKEASGFGVDDILEMSTDDLTEKLTREKGFDESNIENLAEVLVLFGSEMKGKEKSAIIEKAVLLLELTDRISATYSFERSARISELKRML